MRKQTVLLVLELVVPLVLIILWVAFGSSCGPSVAQVGGVCLVYELEDGCDALVTGTDRDRFCDIVRDRLNPRGEVNLEVSFLDDGRLEVLIPHASLSDRRRRSNYLFQWERLSTELTQEEAESLEAVLDRPGAQRHAVISQLQQSHQDLWMALNKVVLAYDAYALVAQRLRLDDPCEVTAMLAGRGQLELRVLPLVNDMGDLSDSAIVRERQRLHEHGSDNWRAVGLDQGYLWLPIRRRVAELMPNAINGSYLGDRYVLVSNNPAEYVTITEGGWEVESAEVDFDNEGHWAVRVVFKGTGGDYFTNFALLNMDRVLAVIVDGEIVSITTVDAVVRGRLAIWGDLSWNAATDLVVKLQAGVLACGLNTATAEVSEVLAPGQGQ
ncbi:MAG: hypothetical protein JW936_08070 [Sedimentisphaerales bacterium]|nr:hypothetical protein [Sedimentisphaerales bacterium]